jgi:hypothetical protein
MSKTQPTVHVCIATGQNAANFIPLEQLDAREVWILETRDMRASASNLKKALQRKDRNIERMEFEDSSPEALVKASEALALKLDGRDVILHVTGGTKPMILALSEELQIIKAGDGSVRTLYADTAKQQIAWLGKAPRTEPMADVITLPKMLMVQGYRIKGDSRHHEALKRAESRADLTREIGENTARYSRDFGKLNRAAMLASKDDAEVRDLTQSLRQPLSKPLEELLQKAEAAGLLKREDDLTITFANKESAGYLCGGWLEEFVLIKLKGMIANDRFSSNLQVESSIDQVPNEIDAMILHRNRALLIECKTGRQDTKAQDRIYKIAQLRDQLGGSVAKALYLSAQPISEEVRQRAEEYRVAVLCNEEISQLVSWIRKWRGE